MAVGIVERGPVDLVFYFLDQCNRVFARQLRNEAPVLEKYSDLRLW